MHIEEISMLLDNMKQHEIYPKARIAFDYTPELMEFLSDQGYVFCIQDDAFGVQIVVSDSSVVLDESGD